MLVFPSDSTLKLTLIFVCVALHFFNGTGLFYSHSFAQKLHILNTEEIDFREISTRISFFARIAGGYCLGKMADRYGFIRTMQVICLIYISINLLLAFFDVSSIFRGEALLCFIHGLISFVRWSSFILPIIYIFQHYKKSDRPTHSALAWTVAILGVMMANLCVSIFKNAQHFNWCIVYAVSSALALMLYIRIANLPKLNAKKAPAEPISKQAISLAFLLALTCGTGLAYQYFFIGNYVTDVMILNIPGQQVIYSPFWITLFSTILLVAQITKNLKTVKIIQISLLGILLSVSILYIFPFLNYFVLLAHQIVFAFSFGLFLPPALRFIYRLLQAYNSYSYMNFIFCLGMSCSTLIAAYLAGLKFLSMPLRGASLIAFLMLACLWVDRHYSFSHKNI